MPLIMFFIKLTAFESIVSDSSKQKLIQKSNFLLKRAEFF